METFGQRHFVINKMLKGQMVNSVEISNSIWSLDLNTWLWTKLEPGGDPPLKCDKTAVWAFRDKAIEIEMIYHILIPRRIAGLSVWWVRSPTRLQHD